MNSVFVLLFPDRKLPASRYSTTTPLPAPQTTRQKHHFFKMFAAVNLSGMFVATLLNMVYGDESGINSEL